MTTTPLSMTALEILEESTTYLSNESNWKKGTLGYVGAPVCAIGAVSIAAGNVETNAWQEGKARYLHSQDAQENYPEGVKAVEFLFDAIPSWEPGKSNRLHAISNADTHQLHFTASPRTGKAKENFIFNQKSAAVIDYNDAPVRTHAEIKDLFYRATNSARAAAAKAKAKAAQAASLEMTPLEVLEESLAFISEKKNWRRGDLGYIGGQVCALGAISQVGGLVDGGYYLRMPTLQDPPAIKGAVEALYEAAPEAIKDPKAKYIEYVKKDLVGDKDERIYETKRTTVYAVNDSYGYESTIKMFEDAIAALKEKKKPKLRLGATKVEPKDALTILREARVLIGKKSNWIQASLGYFDEGKDDWTVCALGALSVAGGHIHTYKPGDFLTSALPDPQIVEPQEDGNGMDEAIDFLFNALPDYHRQAFEESIERANKRAEPGGQFEAEHKTYPTFYESVEERLARTVHTAKKTAIWKYNDYQVKAHRETTRWFDRAIEAAEDAALN